MLRIAAWVVAIAATLTLSGATTLADDTTLNVKVGDKFQIIPSRCDTTVNLYKACFGVRKGVVERVWPIEGRV